MSKKLCGSSFPYYWIINRSDGTAGEDAPLFQMCSYDNKFYARCWGECWTNDFKTINADLFSRRVEKINAESPQGILSNLLCIVWLKRSLSHQVAHT